MIVRRPEMLELYSDYLLSASGEVTATGLSAVSDGLVSHDAVTRFLSSNEFGAKELWLAVKAAVRRYETEDGFLVFDDTLEEKPYTDENDIVCWHYDHSKSRNIKGINIVNAVVRYGDVSFPVSYEVVGRMRILLMRRQVKRSVAHRLARMRCCVGW